MTYKQKYTIYILLMAGLNLVLLAVFIIPSILGIIEQKEQLEELTFNISQQFIFSESSVKSKRQFDEQNAKIQSIYDKSVLTDFNQLDFVTYLETLVVDGVEARISFNPTEKVLRGRIKVSPVSIRAQSSLADFLKYIHELEKSEYYIIFDDISVKPMIRANQPELTTFAQIDAYVVFEQ